MTVRRAWRFWIVKREGCRDMDLLPYFGPVILALGFISGVWYRIEGKINAGVADAKKAGTDAAKKAEEAEKALNEFKLKVVQDYVLWDTVRLIEHRLTERMDSLSQQLVTMPDAVVDRIMKYTKLNPQK